MENEKRKYNAWLLIFSLITSIVLWAFVTWEQDPENERTIRGLIPVFAGEDTVLADRNLRIVAGRNTPVDITFKGRRQDLSRLSEENVTIRVDVSNIHVPNTYTLPYEIEVDSELASRVTESGRKRIDIMVDVITTKEVEVRLKKSYAIPENFLVKQTIFDPATIKLTGPQTVLGTIAYAEVDLVHRIIESSIEGMFDYKLYTEDGTEVPFEGIEADADQVMLNMVISMTKELPLKLSLIDGGGLYQEKNVTWSIEPKTVTVSGDPEILSDLNHISLATVNLSVLKEAGNYEYDIILPENIANASGIAKAVASIDFPGVKSREVYISNIGIRNASPPEGYAVTMVTFSLPVTVRGEEGKVALIRAEDIEAYVDLEGIELTPGKEMASVSLSVNGDFNGAGIVGDYEVMIDVVTIEEP